MNKKIILALLFGAVSAHDFQSLAESTLEESANSDSDFRPIEGSNPWHRTPAKVPAPTFPTGYTVPDFGVD
jgi:hypothetical protein